MANELFAIKNLTLKYFGGYLGVDNVSFSLNKNEILPIYGKFLAGKTSLLRCIAGLEKFDGEIIYNENLDNNISFTFGIDSLKKNDTVNEVLEYPFIIRNISNYSSIIQKKSKQYGIDFLLNKKIKEISDEEKIIVLLVRSLLRDCKLYLLDNPLSGLSDENRAKIFNILKEDLLNKTVVYTTNKIDEAFSLNEKVAIMAYKRIYQIGSINELKSRPVNKEVLVALGYDTYENCILSKNEFGCNLLVKNSLISTKNPISDIYFNKEVIVPFMEGKFNTDIYFDRDTEYLISKK